MEQQLNPDQETEEKLKKLALKGGLPQNADYSGVMLQLQDLYGIMRNSLNPNIKELERIDERIDATLALIESEISGKFKSVQNATAMKVLKRFYKNIVHKDEAVQILEDPA